MDFRYQKHFTRGSQIDIENLGYVEFNIEKLKKQKIVLAYR
ncbi:hypothetical protein DOY81_013415 [Sarcophaga bullata]|nr:hypothetical protein DOY81_013415 [Sarcophaga bullata]